MAERLTRSGRRVRIDAGESHVTANVGRLWVAGAGKAAVAMARAVAHRIPEVQGCVIAPWGADGSRRAGRVSVLRGSHPVPDGRSFAATRTLLQRLARRPTDDTVLFLLSGGASALFECPAQGLRRRDLTELGALLLRSGADIRATNVVRKHVSAVKGGGLLRAAAPRRVVTLALSDVLGDGLDTIGSGPTVPDPSTYADAWSALESLGVVANLPPAVRSRLERGCRGAADSPETVKPGAQEARRSRATVIGSNRIALRAAAHEARRRGYRVRTTRRPLRGDAARAAETFCADLPDDEGPTCVLAGGETTVQVGSATGVGGRNQELAVAAMRPLAGRSWCLLAAGTDGVDGPTVAAGGFADGRSARRAGARALDRALRQHDSFLLLDRLGDTLITGPSGTNVMDVLLAIRPPQFAR